MRIRQTDMALSESAGAMFHGYQLAEKAGIELSICEVNHRTTNGDAPPEPRNRRHRR